MYIFRKHCRGHLIAFHGLRVSCNDNRAKQRLVFLKDVCGRGNLVVKVSHRGCHHEFNPSTAKDPPFGSETEIYIKVISKTQMHLVGQTLSTLVASRRSIVFIDRKERPLFFIWNSTHLSVHRQKDFLEFRKPEADWYGRLSKLTPNNPGYVQGKPAIGDTWSKFGKPYGQIRRTVNLGRDPMIVKVSIFCCGFELIDYSNAHEVIHTSPVLQVLNGATPICKDLNVARVSSVEDGL
ncbi:uncharacterized protein TNCV_5046991 [Trichonephila clavipes]|nr:uncharacterized protein TNCV_5046991 [Trichonephila clavipes]